MTHDSTTAIKSRVEYRAVTTQPYIKITIQPKLTAISLTQKTRTQKTISIEINNETL